MFQEVYRREQVFMKNKNKRLARTVKIIDKGHSIADFAAYMNLLADITQKIPFDIGYGLAGFRDITRVNKAPCVK